MQDNKNIEDIIIEKSMNLSKNSSISVNNSIKFYSMLYGYDYPNNLKTELLDN